MARSDRSQSDGFGDRSSAQPPGAPFDVPYGPRTLGASGDLVVQLDRGGVGEQVAAGGDHGAAVHAAATHGTSGSAGALPHLDTIQASFGRHDVGGVEAHVDGAARQGAAAMGAEAFATGNHVAFASAPTLHTAAHEAAHVVQQRAGVQLKGGVGAEGDSYERHADQVADRVVAGQSAEALLDEVKPSGGASKTGSGASVVATEPGGLERSGASAAPDAAGSGASVQRLAADEVPPRATTLQFGYDEAAMHRFAQGSPGAASALSAFRSFQDASMKDGQTLSDAEKFCLAWQAMADDPRRETILAAVFFGDTSASVHTDHVQSIRPSAGGVTVTFWYPNESGNNANIQPMSFTSAVPYTGKDDNLRERRVQSAKHGFMSPIATRVAYTKDSFVYQEYDKIADRFLDTPAGAAWKDVPADERPRAYTDAVQDYIYEMVLPDRAQRIVYQQTALLQAWVETNPAPDPCTADWVQRLSLEAMRLVTGYDNPDLFAEPHAVWYVEDEAAAQLLVEGLGLGIKVNFDADARTVSVVSMPRATANPAPVVAPGPQEDPTAANLPVITKTMDAIHGHLNTAQRYYDGDGVSEAGLHVGADSQFVTKLPPESQVAWSSFGLTSAGPLDERAELGPYMAFLQAWYDLEDAKANKADTALLQEAFDAALAAFKASLG